MSKKKRRDPDDPKPLNFDHDQKGPNDRLQKPFMTPADATGKNEEDQYYEQEEALSPEEVKKRKEEDSM